MRWLDEDERRRVDLERWANETRKVVRVVGWPGEQSAGWWRLRRHDARGR